MNSNADKDDAKHRTGFNGGSTSRVSNALIENVDVTIETFLGETSMTIAELSELDIGCVVTLDAALNEAVELRVNGVSIALGELVAVGDKFGVRVTSVSS